MYRIKIITIIIVLFSLSACGYRLAGKADLDPVFESTYVTYKRGGAAVAELLEKQFRANDIKIVAEKDAAVIVNVLYEQKKQEILSVDEQGKVREYALIMRVGVNAKTVDNKKLMPTQNIRLTRDFIFDIDDVLGKQREAAEIYQEMREDISRLIIYRLQAVEFEVQEDLEESEES